MKKQFLFLLLAASFLALICNPIYAKDTASMDADHEAKISDIHKLLDLTGSAHVGMQMMNQVVTQFKTTMPDVPDKVWDDLMQEVKETDLENLIVPIYDKHFTRQDITDLINFYQTSIGQKLIKETPAIAQESIAVGMQWGAGLGEKITKKLESKGYKPHK